MPNWNTASGSRVAADGVAAGDQRGELAGQAERAADQVAGGER
jgi:hypothetical protein